MKIFITLSLLNAVPVPSQESEQSLICVVLEESILLLSMVFQLDYGTVQNYLLINYIICPHEHELLYSETETCHT